MPFRLKKWHILPWPSIPRNQRNQLQHPHPQQPQKRCIRKYKGSNATCPPHCALSKLLIPITSRSLHPQEKGEKPLSPPHSLRRHLQAAWSQPLPSVSIDEKVHLGFLGNPTFLVIAVWQSRPWEVATTSAPPPFLVLNLPFRAQSFLPAPVLSYWSLTWICHNPESPLLIH